MNTLTPSSRKAAAPGKLSFTLSSLSLGNEFDDFDNGFKAEKDILDDVFGCIPITKELEELETPTLPIHTIQALKSIKSIVQIPILPNLSLRDMKNLGLSQANLDHLKDIFLTLHLRSDGAIDLDSFHEFFKIRKSPWSARIFSYLDFDHSGKVDFIEWIAFTTHICTANEDGLARMVFSMYDKDQTKILNTACVVQLLHDVHAGSSNSNSNSSNNRKITNGNSNEPWSPNYVGKKVGQALSALPFDPNTGNLTLNAFCNACKYNQFILEPIHILATSMIKQIGGRRFWDNIIRVSRNNMLLRNNILASSNNEQNAENVQTRDNKEKVPPVEAHESAEIGLEYADVNELSHSNVLELCHDDNKANNIKSNQSTLQSNPVQDNKQFQKTSLIPVNKTIGSTNWFHRFGVKYEKGGLFIPWSTSPTDDFLKKLEPHHENKHGHSIHKQGHSRSTNTKLHVVLKKTISDRINALENRMLSPTSIVSLRKCVRVTSPPLNLDHPKHFYNRVMPQTSADQRGKIVRNNQLKPHVQKVLRSERSKNRRPKTAQNKRSSNQQKLAFKNLTRTWKKTPCFYCGLEGHLSNKCQKLIKQKKRLAIKRKLQKFHGIQPKLTRRIVLSSKKEKTSNPLIQRISGGMNSKKRSELLAFAVKRSLIEAVSWADQARLTGASMENARRAAKRHHSSALLKNRKERINQLRPRETGIF